MFMRAESFNQPLNKWNIPIVDGYEMPQLQTYRPSTHWDMSNGSFNQPLNNWNVSNVTI